MNELSIAQNIAIWVIPVVFAVTLHEVAHGWVASLCGDQTARFSGRLTLNPIKHVDPVGTVLVPLLLMVTTHFQFIFGWAKPVPVDPRNFRHPRRDLVLVAFAGPLSNLLMAVFWGMIAKIGMIAEHGSNLWLGVPLIYMGGAGIQINVMLGVLNLIPLPPLDGGNMISGLLPRRAAYYYGLVEPYGFFILVIMMFTGVLYAVMAPFVIFLINLIAGLFGLA